MEKTTGIYIHIPFCVSKCSYCDFNSYSGKFSLVEKYIEYLEKEIELSFQDLKDREVETIFIGGGTPSTIDGEYIYKILNKIYESTDIDFNNVEITMEGNPGTFTDEKIEWYKKAKVNRISLGVQSFNIETLKTLNRIHSTEDVKNTVYKLKKAGFHNLNLDIMMGLPEEDWEDVKYSLEEAIKLEPEHISLYSLILEEGTILTDKVDKNILTIPNEEIEREIYHNSIECLEKNGYYQYEVSNFSKKGKESRHNLDCWNIKEYLGFGLSASSYFENKRFRNKESFIDYFKLLDKNLKPIDIESIEKIGKKESISEFFILGFRKKEGIKISDFIQKYGVEEYIIYEKIIDKEIKKGLLQKDLDRVFTTKKGLDILNQILVEFL